MKLRTIDEVIADLDQALETGIDVRRVVIRTRDELIAWRAQGEELAAKHGHGGTELRGPNV